MIARVVDAGGRVAGIAGLLAWMWLGDWRWLLTGLCVMAACIVMADALGGEEDQGEEEVRS